MNWHKNAKESERKGCLGKCSQPPCYEELKLIIYYVHIPFTSWFLPLLPPGPTLGQPRAAFRVQEAVPDQPAGPRRHHDSEGAGRGDARAVKAGIGDFDDVGRLIRKGQGEVRVPFPKNE